MEEAVIEAWRHLFAGGGKWWVLGHLGDLGFLPRKPITFAPCLLSARHIFGGSKETMIVWPDALGSLATCLGDRVEIRTDRSDPRDDHPVFLVLDHYPMASWNRSFHGAVQLHGHVHDGLENEGIRRFDVGVDSIGVEPVSESEIIDQALAIDPPKYTDG